MILEVPLLSSIKQAH